MIRWGRRKSWRWAEVPILVGAAIVIGSLFLHAAQAFIPSPDPTESVAALPGYLLWERLARALTTTTWIGFGICLTGIALARVRLR
jgi:hypothetical protein